MNLQRVRQIDRLIGVPLCWLSSLWHKGLAVTKPQSSPKRILVLLLSEMGSLVLAKPMFQQLKRRYPEAEIHVLLFENNRSALELLELLPPERIHGMPSKSIGSLITGLAGLILKLRRFKFDVSIDCELFSRISSLLSLYSGAATRVGFTPHTQEGLYRGHFINRPVLYNPYRHISLQFLHLAEAIQARGKPLLKHAVEWPVVEWKKPLESTKQSAIRQRLQQQYIGILQQPLILLYPSGGALPIRAWPEDSYVELMQQLLAQGFEIGIIGLANDRTQAERLRARLKQSPAVYNLAGFTATPEELVYVLSLAQALITNDGGPAHFATLADLPCVVLFGPETPDLYRPLNDKTRCLHQALPCSPCLTAYNHRNSPCDGDNQCLKQISVERVMETVLALTQPSEPV